MNVHINEIDEQNSQQNIGQKPELSKKESFESNNTSTSTSQFIDNQKLYLYKQYLPSLVIHLITIIIAIFAFLQSNCNGSSFLLSYISLALIEHLIFKLCYFNLRSLLSYQPTQYCIDLFASDLKTKSLTSFLIVSLTVYYGTVVSLKVSCQVVKLLIVVQHIIIGLYLISLIQVHLYVPCKEFFFAEQQITVNRALPQKSIFYRLKRVEMQDNKQINENNECIICWDTFSKGDQLIQLECNSTHGFHQNCIQIWFQLNSKCPICKKPVRVQ